MNLWQIVKTLFFIAATEALNILALIIKNEITYLKFIFIIFSHILRRSQVIIQFNLITLRWKNEGWYFRVLSFYVRWVC